MSDPYEQLKTWLDERGGDRRGVGELESLDLTAYLRETIHVNLAKYQMLQELTDAAEGPFRAELSNRLAHLRHMIDADELERE